MTGKLLVTALSLFSWATFAGIPTNWDLSKSESKASTLSQTFDFSQASTPEIQFDYQILKAEAGALFLEASTDDGKTWDFVWAISGKLGEKWFNQRVPLASFAGEEKVQLRFRSTTGSDFSSDLSVKNVEVRKAPKTECKACASL